MLRQWMSLNGHIFLWRSSGLIHLNVSWQHNRIIEQHNFWKCQKLNFKITFKSQMGSVFFLQQTHWGMRHSRNLVKGHLFFLDVSESSDVIRSIGRYTGNDPRTWGKHRQGKRPTHEMYLCKTAFVFLTDMCHVHYTNSKLLNVNFHHISSTAEQLHWSDCVENK